MVMHLYNKATQPRAFAASFVAGSTQATGFLLARSALLCNQRGS